MRTNITLLLALITAFSLPLSAQNDQVEKLANSANMLDSLSWDSYEAGDYAMAVHYGQQALAIRGLTLGKENEDYAASLAILAFYQSESGNYAKAVQLGEQALALWERLNGTENAEYATLLMDLADYQDELGNYPEAIQLAEQALTIKESVLNIEDEDFFLDLGRLWMYYCDAGDYAEASHIAEKALAVREHLSGNENISYVSALEMVAFAKAKSGDKAAAIRFYEQARAIMERVLGTENEDYIEILSTLAKYHDALGNYAEAVQLNGQALSIQERVLGTENEDYFISLNNLAVYQSHLGNHAEAVRWGKQALITTERVLGTENEVYARCLNNLAMELPLSDPNKYTEAVRMAEQALSILERVSGTENQYYVNSLNTLAKLQMDQGNFTEAAQLWEQALAATKIVLGTENDFYATILFNLAHLKLWFGYYEESAHLAEEARTIWECIRGVEHPDYATALIALSESHFFQHSSAQVNHYAAEITPLITKIVKRSFSSLTASERATFWNEYENWYQRFAHLYAFALPSDTLSANGYNAVLLSKGLLLNSEIEFTKLIQESGDEEALALFKDLQARRIQIRKLIEKPIADRPLDVDSLSREADKVEQQLVERSKVYGDFTKNLVITWDQVQEKLTDKDAAVEFVSFPWNADSTMYIAYVLRKDWACPRMIPLFEEKELEAIGGYDYYTTPSVSHLVWEPLEEALEGADHVYFSPSGDLYNIAIESVPDHLDPAHLVGDRRDYYRLSSTRELAIIQDDYTWTEGAVYGGLDYNMGISSLAADEAHYAQSSANGGHRGGIDLSYYYLGGESLAEGIRSDRKSSGLLDSLPGTREEAVAIKAQLDDISVPSSLYTDDLGTEASFKALDGQRKSIIHIGTHGFFNTKKTEYQDPTSLLMTSSQQTVRVEDDALSRSGLCMAGANNLLTNADALPDSLDDGWLTALEIAHLDLRGLDMVVLSACKTGVGEVTGDGVFGLQRGFKKAGARTLVMSLWNVPDQLTCYFMKEFFARISVDKDGHPTNKHAAFQQAQQAARTHWQEVDPLAAPYDWAAFILLDGVD